MGSPTEKQSETGTENQTETRTEPAAAVPPATSAPDEGVAPPEDPMQLQDAPLQAGGGVERERLMAILEAVLFASEEPLTLKKLRDLLDHPDTKELREVLGALEERYAQGERGFEVVEVAGGYQFRTRPEHSDWVRKLKASKPSRLTRPALETLAIIAYRQPVTRPEIEEIRRVDSGAVIHTLLERGLVRILGRKDVPGRPALYGTTKVFLETFGLRDLAQLPALREIEDLGAEPADVLEWAKEEERPGGEGGTEPVEMAVSDGEAGANGATGSDPEHDTELENEPEDDEPDPGEGAGGGDGTGEPESD